jgi:hypothetical protein
MEEKLDALTRALNGRADRKLYDDVRNLLAVLDRDSHSSPLVRKHGEIHVEMKGTIKDSNGKITQDVVVKLTLSRMVMAIKEALVEANKEIYRAEEVKNLLNEVELRIIK